MGDRVYATTIDLTVEHLNELCRMNAYLGAIACALVELMPTQAGNSESYRRRAQVQARIAEGDGMGETELAGRGGCEKCETYHTGLDPTA